MDPVVLTKTLAAASLTGVASAQSGTANVGLTLASNIVALDTQRRLVVSSSGNDTGVTWTVTGTRQGGIPIVDTFPGANGGGAQSNLDFLTVTSVVPSSAPAANVSVGTNQVGSTPYQLTDYHLTRFNITIATVTSGSVNYSIEQTFDDFYTPQQRTVLNPTTVVPTAFGLLANVSANSTVAILSPIRGWRLTVNSGSGTATATAIQAGIRN